MTANIIQFSNRRSGLAHGPGSGNDEHKKFREKVVAAIRVASHDSKAKFERDQEVGPAQAVDRLIAKIKAKKICDGAGRRITLGDIQSRLATKGVHARHIERLRVDHTLPPSEALKKLSKTHIRKIQAYVQVLDELAEIIGSPADDVLCEAFKTTEFYQRNQPEVGAPASRFSWLLHEMTNSLIRSEKLEEYYRDAECFKAGYDPVSRAFPYLWLRVPNGERETIDRRTLAGWWGDAGGPVAPEVPLVRLHRATFSGPLEIEKDVIAPATRLPERVVSIWDSVNEDTDETGKRPLGDLDIVDCEIVISADIVLAIGAAFPGDRLGPVFQLRSHVALKVNGTECPLTFNLSVFPLSHCRTMENGFYKPYAGTVAALFDDGWRRIAGGFGHKNWKLLTGEFFCGSNGFDAEPTSPMGPAERDEYFGTDLDSGLRLRNPLAGANGVAGFNHDYIAEFSYGNVEVSPTSVERLMSIVSGRNGNWTFLTELKGSARVYLWDHDNCRRIEGALYSGLLERALVEESQRLRRKLNESIEKLNDAYKQQEQDMLARWRSM